MKPFHNRYIAILVSLSLALAQFVHLSWLDSVSAHETRSHTALIAHQGDASHSDADHDHGLDIVHSVFHAHADVVTGIFLDAGCDGFNGKHVYALIAGVFPADRGLAPPVPPPLS